MKDNISSERQRNGATQTTPESNHMSSSASPSPPFSASSFDWVCEWDDNRCCTRADKYPEWVGKTVPELVAEIGREVEAFVTKCNGQSPA